MPDTKDPTVQSNRAGELAAVLSESFRELALRHERLSTSSVDATLTVDQQVETQGIAQVVADVMKLRYPASTLDWFAPA